MGKYDDIINLPHHVSSVHKKMSLHDRAAQFAPFAALTGYEEKIAETARLTSGKVLLSQDGKEELDMQLGAYLAGDYGESEAAVTYFRPDGSKEGGAYVTEQGTIKKVDMPGRMLVFDDGRGIDLDDILSIEFCRDE
ncbi:MAG: hypothetical protein ILP10_06665 [Lachnospiraceae bacterium]|nr:hypothetical protein [Lachnospiraceae bacterium]